MLLNLSASGFRSLAIDLSFSPGVNLIWGDNGSGKSSILETIHYIAFSRSFRTSQADTMISHKSPSFLLGAQIEHSGLMHDIAIQRVPGTIQVRHQGDKAALSKIAPLCPTLFIDSDSHRHYFSSAASRRRLFDWLVFHVKHDYLPHVRKYNLALRNRNAALKNQEDTSPWESIMINEARPIHLARLAVFEEVAPLFLSNGVSCDQDINLRYDPGYDVKQGLAASLAQSRSADLSAKRTAFGPHRADWPLYAEGVKASDVLSQGQQKTAFFLLTAAQQQLMTGCGIHPLIMVDDYSAELDAANREFVCGLVLNQAGQSIVTGVLERDVSGLSVDRVFHVKQGRAREAL